MAKKYFNPDIRFNKSMIRQQFKIAITLLKRFIDNKEKEKATQLLDEMVDLKKAINN